MEYFYDGLFLQCNHSLLRAKPYHHLLPIKKQPKCLQNQLQSRLYRTFINLHQNAQQILTDLSLESENAELWGKRWKFVFFSLSSTNIIANKETIFYLFSVFHIFDPRIKNYWFTHQIHYAWHFSRKISLKRIRRLFRILKLYRRFQIISSIGMI